VDTGRMIKIPWTILATPPSHLKVGCGTGGRTDVGASVWDGHLGQK